MVKQNETKVQNEKHKETAQRIKETSQKTLDELIVRISLLALPISLVTKSFLPDGSKNVQGIFLLYVAWVLFFLAFIGVIASHKTSILAAHYEALIPDNILVKNKVKKADLFGRVTAGLNVFNFWVCVLGITIYFFFHILNFKQ